MLLYYCITVLLYYCIIVLLYYCITVVLYFGITVILYYSSTVLLYYCITVLLYYCITGLLYSCITALLYCIGVLLSFCVTAVLYYRFVLRGARVILSRTSTLAYPSAVDLLPSLRHDSIAISEASCIWRAGTVEVLGRVARWWRSPVQSLHGLHVPLGQELRSRVVRVHRGPVRSVPKDTNE